MHNATANFKIMTWCNQAQPGSIKPMQPNLEPDANRATRHFGFGTQIRKSPYFDATVRWGATGFSVYNHMYIPVSYTPSPSPRDED